MAVGTVFAVASQSQSFSVEKFCEFIKTASPVYLAAALLCMIGYIMFEALAIRAMCREFKFRCSLKNSFVYSASDIYFSAITPSASGGQPACGYFMVKDGIPAVFTTVALVANLAAYAFSTLSVL